MKNVITEVAVTADGVERLYAERCPDDFVVDQYLFAIVQDPLCQGGLSRVDMRTDTDIT